MQITINTNSGSGAPSLGAKPVLIHEDWDTNSGVTKTWTTTKAYPFLIVKLYAGNNKLGSILDGVKVPYSAITNIGSYYTKDSKDGVNSNSSVGGDSFLMLNVPSGYKFTCASTSGLNYHTEIVAWTGEAFM